MKLLLPYHRCLKQPSFYLSLLLLGSSAGCGVVRNELGTAPTPQESIAPLQTNPSTSPLTPPKLTSLDYVAQIVQRVGPAVVRIDSTRTVAQSFGDSGFERFFGGQVPRSQRVQRGTGSGFITTSDGRVLTNAHVVQGADSVTVVLRDGRRFKGTVVGADSTTDVAVIKINAQNLPIVKLGNSDNLLPGQAAIAIGNPLGLSFTVTQGIISATGRSAADVGVPAERVDFIQTDAAINPGNSGGPLINAEGEVIGINSAIIQGAAGLGFAIPIATASRVAEQIVATGKAQHPYLGVQMAELTPEIRNELNQSDAGFTVNQDQGVLIVAVQSNSPAARGGLRQGDVVASINGTAIQTAQQVQQQVEAAAIGSPLQIVVNRNGQKQTLTVKPEPLPARELRQDN
ncbi:MAG: trypsin-like peptidase domain-containing protein [Lyngbya sp. HA4199-MV5]|jgi:S1-C subfamily serine protease|nr:trypsin-like peptidase domain-containing protein [Lyngbya sp. HA4199-MV5]